LVSTANPLRPMSDERCCDSGFVHPRFVQPEKARWSCWPNLVLSVIGKRIFLSPSPG
jgi:hypothetical protein